MKIIHTSDWHLGARLHEEDRADEHRAFLDWLAQLMKSEKPDALIVSGDVFDVKAPSPQAQTLYYGFLARVVKERLCRKTIVAAGNHDSARMLAAPSRLLEELGVAVVSSTSLDGGPAGRVVTVEGDGGAPALSVAVIPFLFDAELANIGLETAGDQAPRDEKTHAGWKKACEDAIAAARAAAPGAPVAAVAHCTLANAKKSDGESERCRRIGGIDAYDPAPLSGADYAALGHLHIPQSVKGFEKKMFYSGSPLKMSFDEAGREKSVNIVTFDGPGNAPSVRLAEIPQTVPILTVEGTPGEAEGKLAELVAADRNAKRFVRVRLKDFDGPAKEHWQTCRKIAEGSMTLILEENDMRPAVRETAGLKAFSGQEIKQLDPRDVAKQKLKTCGRNFSDSQVEEFMDMYDEVAGGIT